MSEKQSWYAASVLDFWSSDFQKDIDTKLDKVRSQKKRYYLGIFPNMGGGLPKSQNFCKFTKYFFVCQIHSEVLKHILQMGRSEILSISTFNHYSRILKVVAVILLQKKYGITWELFPKRGGGPLFPKLWVNLPTLFWKCS